MQPECQMQRHTTPHTAYVILSCAAPPPGSLQCVPRRRRISRIRLPRDRRAARVPGRGFTASASDACEAMTACPCPRARRRGGGAPRRQIIEPFAPKCWARLSADFYVANCCACASAKTAACVATMLTHGTGPWTRAQSLGKIEAHSVRSCRLRGELCARKARPLSCRWRSRRAGRTVRGGRTVAPRGPGWRRRRWPGRARRGCYSG